MKVQLTESVLQTMPTLQSMSTPTHRYISSCLDVWRGRGQLAQDELHQGQAGQTQAPGRNNFEEHRAYGPALRVAEEVDDDRVGPYEVGFEGFGDRGPEELERGGKCSDVESTGGDDATVKVRLIGRRAW